MTPNRNYCTYLIRRLLSLLRTDIVNVVVKYVNMNLEWSHVEINLLLLY